MARKRKDQTLTVMLFVIFILLAFLVGLQIGLIYAPTNTIIREVPIEKTVEKIVLKDVPERTTKANLAAVDSNGNGVIAELTVRVRNGNGLILVNINDVLADLDTQYSARTAAEAASRYSGVDIGNLDIIYNIKTDAPIISGQSAGAAMSIATIASLVEKDINRNIVVTGTIDKEGNIGRVGGILAKAKAVEAEGFTTFVVPYGQSEEIIYKQEQECKTTGAFKFCRINYVPERIDIGKEVGITVVAVKNLEEAVPLFLGY